MQQVSGQRTLAFPLAFPCVFWKFEVGERFGLKYGGGERHSPALPHTLTTDDPNTHI